MHGIEHINFKQFHYYGTDMSSRRLGPDALDCLNLTKCQKLLLVFTDEACTCNSFGQSVKDTDQKCLSWSHHTRYLSHKEWARKENVMLRYQNVKTQAYDFLHSYLGRLICTDVQLIMFFCTADLSHRKLGKLGKFGENCLDQGHDKKDIQCYRYQGETLLLRLLSSEMIALNFRFKRLASFKITSLIYVCSNTTERFFFCPELFHNQY